MTLILPFRYGLVEEDVSRGAYPKEKNYTFLKRYYYNYTFFRLKLKTILSLIPEPPNNYIVKFCQKYEISNYWIRVNKPKENIPLTYSKIIQCLQVNLIFIIIGNYKYRESSYLYSL